MTIDELSLCLRLFLNLTFQHMPINKLPLEILQEIFELLIGKLGCGPLSVEDGLAIQVVLCGICHVWHQIALDDPLLWNTLSFPITKRSIKRTKLFLQCSTTAPINIISPKVPVARTYVSEFLKLIIAESHRWKVVEVRVGHIMTLRLIWGGQVPMLKELMIDM
jgi:F-box-like